MRITKKETDAIQAHIAAFNEKMAELGCDSVQVIATAIDEDGDTIHLHYGTGNLYARMGAAQDWIGSLKGGTLAREIAHALPKDES
jgi:hypothetical protein